MPEPMRPARTDLLAAATAAGLRASSPAPVPCARVDASKDCEMPIRGGASPGRPFLGGSSDPVNRVLTLFEKPRRPFRVSLGRSGRCLEAGLDPFPNLTTH